MLASACQSLWNTDETGGSEMGDAWTNYGASAYVGSTVDLPPYMDTFTREFWQSMCYQEQNVGASEVDASIAQGFGSHDMQVHGNSGSTLPN